MVNIDYLKPLIKNYVSRGLDYIEANESGILAAARSGEDLVPALASKYLPMMLKLDPAVVPVLQHVVRSYDVPLLARPVIAEVVQEAKTRPGELGTVAQEQPEWLADHMRRLLNLALLRIANWGEFVARTAGNSEGTGQEPG